MSAVVDILSVLKRDESKAFELLFERYYDNLLLYTFQILDDLDAAEDIVQECFVFLWNSKRLQNFEGDLDRFIFRIVKNQAFLYLKSNKKRSQVHGAFVEMQELCEEVVPENGFQDVDLLYRTIDALPEKCRRVFLLAALNDKTYQEIADECGVSINTVKSQLKTAFRFLRENLSGRHFMTLCYCLVGRQRFSAVKRL